MTRNNPLLSHEAIGKPNDLEHEMVVNSSIGSAIIKLAKDILSYIPYYEVDPVQRANIATQRGIATTKTNRRQLLQKKAGSLIVHPQ